MHEVIHNLYVNEEGEIYCIKQNRIINIHNEGYPCGDCEFCFGSLQGEGVECKYRDIYFLGKSVVCIHDMKQEQERVNKHLLHMLRKHKREIVLYGIDSKYIALIREKCGEDIIVHSYHSDFCKLDLGECLIVNRNSLGEEEMKYLSHWCQAFGMEFEFIQVDEETIEQDLDKNINICRR